MMTSFRIKPPKIIRTLFPGTIWHLESLSSKCQVPSSALNKVYFTFDDGPTPEITPWVIDSLNRYNATATFFCVGNNVIKYPEIFQQLLDNGMSVGNHTFSHLKAFKTTKNNYFADIDKCSEVVKSDIFRPPHGQLYPWWIPKLKKRFSKIVMWDILSLDYDSRLTAEDVVNIVTTRIRPGSVIVFHDSLKAWDRLKIALPKILEYAIEKGYEMRKISIGV